MNNTEKLITIVALLFVGIIMFVPINTTEQYTEKEYYTVSEPYSDTDYYTESVPYTTTEYYTVQEPYTVSVSVPYQEELYGTAYSGWITDSGVTDYTTTFTGMSSWNKEFTGHDLYGNTEYTFTLCDLTTCYSYFGINSWSISPYTYVSGYETKYKFEQETKYKDVQKSKEVTKYKDVQKSRTVTKYKDVQKSRDTVKTREVSKSIFQRIFG